MTLHVSFEIKYKHCKVFSLNDINISCRSLKQKHCFSLNGHKNSNLPYFLTYSIKIHVQAF